MNEDEIIIFDPMKDLKELAEEIERQKQENERGLQSWLAITKESNPKTV